jgi:ATP-dependent DNA ligase
VLFQQAEKLGLEGIVGKLLSSPYLPGKRSPYWVKCKCEKVREMYFNKYTVNNAGIRVEDENEIAVQVSGHQSEAVKKEIDEKGKVLIEVKYLNVTENNRLRMPTFKRMVL